MGKPRAESDSQLTKFIQTTFITIYPKGTAYPYLWGFLFSVKTSLTDKDNHNIFRKL